MYHPVGKIISKHFSSNNAKTLETSFGRTLRWIFYFMKKQDDLLLKCVSDFVFPTDAKLHFEQQQKAINL